MSSDQYSVLGQAPGSEDLKKLSSSDVHLQLNNYQLDMEKWKFFIILIYLLARHNHYV